MATDASHMISNPDQAIIDEYKDFLIAKDFPCVAARAAVSKQQVTCMVADHMACPKDDIDILRFLYNFIDHYRITTTLFHSATVIFKGPDLINEDLFDNLLWQRLQALAALDNRHFEHDRRVDNDPSSPNFGFSLKEEALFIIGLHPGSSRMARQFKYPALAFNPHAQFEQLRSTNSYARMKSIVRKRDLAYSGSVNPMLDDFGGSSEVFQYSGRKYDDKWLCPLQQKFQPVENNTTS